MEENKMQRVPSPNVCRHCGKIIVLKRNGQHYKWFSARGKKTLTWKCPAPNFPVRSHSPEQTEK